jgi:pilus assembly protein CpaB
MLTRSKSAKRAKIDISEDSADDLPAGPETGKRKSRLDIAAMKQKPWWRLETALMGGAVAAAVVSGFMSHQNSLALEDSMSRRYKTEAVIVASGELKAGTTLDESNVKRSVALKNSLSRNVIMGDQLDLVLGHRIAVDLLPGDPILLSMVQGARDAKGIAEKIPPGKRLFTLTIDSKAAGYGFVNPNDHVDILAQIDLPDRGTTSFTLLEDVTLVSVGARSVLQNGARVSGSDVSFFVTPREFEVLSFAQKRGTFSLSLRNPRDIGKMQQQSGKAGVDIDSFLDHNMVSEASGGGALEVEIDGSLSKSGGAAPKGKKQ